MKAALYARVSTDDGSQDAGNQVTVLTEWASKLGHTLTEQYVDNASGKNQDRPEFQRLLRDSKTKKWEVLLFWSLDRITREGVLPTLQILDQFNQHGKHWQSYTEQYVDSCAIFAPVVLSILATLAKQERSRISERTKAGLARVRRDGSRSGKAIGRPVKAFELAHAQALLRTQSISGAAKTMGVARETFRNKVFGRAVPQKAAREWSAPECGEIHGGIFEAAENGGVVIRYDRVSGEAHCVGHGRRLAECMRLHEAAEWAGSEFQGRRIAES